MVCQPADVARRNLHSIVNRAAIRDAFVAVVLQSFGSCRYTHVHPLKHKSFGLRWPVSALDRSRPVATRLRPSKDTCRQDATEQTRDRSAPYTQLQRPL